MNRSKPNNIRQRTRRKIKHQERVEKRHDDQLYMTARLDPQTVDGQSKIVLEDSPKKQASFLNYFNFFKLL